MARLLVFCESPSDFATTRALVERVLLERGPDWVRDLVDASLAYGVGLLEWVADGEGRSHFDLHKLPSYVLRHKLRVPHGHFAGRPGEAGSLMGRTALRVARELALVDTELGAVLLVWDMDDQGASRCEGLKQARTEARDEVGVPFDIILGCSNPMREAWVLAGFEPETDEERASLAALRQELGFNPCEEAHRLDAKNEQAKRNPKRVLETLVLGEHAREARCYTDAPLGLLRTRGKDSGLTAFLDEVAESLIPRLSNEPPRPPPE
jgi:hypothetical protein